MTTTLTDRPTLQLARRSDGWWIEGMPEVERCGPYDTRQEAESDLRGMNWFYRHAKLDSD